MSESEGRASRDDRDAPIGALERVIRIEEAAGAVLIVAILLLVIVQIVARYVLNSPFVWTGEIARFGLIWVTFLGAAFVMARGRHITVDVVSQPFGPRGRMLLDISASLITIVTALVILPESLSLTMAMSSVGSPAADVPMSVVYAAGLTGFSLLALHCIIRTILAIRSGPGAYADEDIGEQVTGGGAE